MSTRANTCRNSAVRFLLPALFALGLFIALPLAGSLRGSNDDLVLYEIDTREVTPPLPPPPPRKPPEAQPPDSPKPRLNQPRPRMQIQAALSLDLSLGRPAGDFGLDFAVQEPVIEPDLGNLVFEISDLDTPPEPLAPVSPVYPPRARAQRVEGQVELEFVVGADGTARDIAVLSATPPGYFEASALRAVERWRFQPGIRAGQQVAVRVRQSLSYSLQ